MKIDALVESRSSPVLYHFIGTGLALGALMRGSFQLGTGSDSDRQLNQTYPFYLSCARSAHGRYANGHKVGVQFELNRNWLRDRYKIIPLNYWAGFPMRDSEQEDRVLSRTPEMEFPPSPVDLIRAIHMLLPNHDGALEWGTKTERSVILQARRMGIPCHVYTNPKGFYSGNPRLAASPSEMMDILKVKRRDEFPPYRRIPRDDLSGYRELLFKKHRDELDKEGMRVYRNLDRAWNHDSFIRTMSADLHNAQTMNRQSAHKTIMAMRQKGIRTIQDYVEQMYAKWFPDQS